MRTIALRILLLSVSAFNQVNQNRVHIDLFPPVALGESPISMVGELGIKATPRPDPGC